MADKHRNAHAGRVQREVGQGEDLPRLLAELVLLGELAELALGRPVHREIGLRGLRLAQAAAIAASPAPDIDW